MISPLFPDTLVVYRALELEAARIRAELKAARWQMELDAAGVVVTKPPTVEEMSVDSEQLKAFVADEVGPATKGTCYNISDTLALPRSHRPGFFSYCHRQLSSQGTESTRGFSAVL